VLQSGPEALAQISAAMRTRSSCREMWRDLFHK
jgi:hypothetical protein